MGAKPSDYMRRDDFLRHAEGRRMERVDGRPVAMAPERADHAQVKGNAYVALRFAVRKAGVPCQVFPDGLTVAVDDHTDFEPDALVTCGDRVPGDAVSAPNPVIVVEVVSPSSRSIDTGPKLLGYFKVPSVRHYLIVSTAPRGVVHHARSTDGGIVTSIAAAGILRLDPPGIDLDVDAVFAD